jgi:hypothetical protein
MRQIFSRIPMRAWTLAAVAACLASPACAQDRTIPSGQALTVPGSTRALGMGNLALDAADDAIFYAPSQLVRARGTSGSAEFYDARTWLATLSTVVPLAGGALGAGVQSLTYDQPLATTIVVAPGSSAPPSFASALSQAFVVAYAHGAPFRLRIGGAAALKSDLGYENERDTRAVFDLGVSRDVPGGVAALTVQNVGRRMLVNSFAVDLPMRTTAAYQLEPIPLGVFDVSAVAGVTWNRRRWLNDASGFAAVYQEQWWQPAGGVDVGYSWLDGYEVHLRGGVRHTGVGDGPYTLGAGISADRWTLQYAFDPRQGARAAHRIGVEVH